MNCNTTHYRANSSSVPGDPTLFNTGRDDEAQKQLQLALALSPSRELPLAATSPMFSQVVSQARESLAKGPKGSLLIESVPSGAAVSVDGASLGNTPLNVKDVPPGSHVWKVSFPSGETTGGMVEVAGGKQAKAMGQSGSKDAETKMLTALSLNRIDSEFLSAAKEHAQTKGVDVVLFGALSRDGKNLALDAFLFSASKAEVRRIGRPTFDAELLSAGLEFYKLVGQLVQSRDKLGEPSKVPGSVSVALGSSGPRVADVAYGRAFEREGVGSVGSVGSGDEAQKPAETPNASEPKRRVPLVKKKP